MTPNALPKPRLTEEQELRNLAPSLPRVLARIEDPSRLYPNSITSNLGITGRAPGEVTLQASAPVETNLRGDLLISSSVGCWLLAVTLPTGSKEAI